ncbi:MAG: MnhB domain-containing protein [Candidatus Omnitrophica bacterium]|nr:MnhB domain-containing protein [Candidatus Omnitrophota bacterium]
MKQQQGMSLIVKRITKITVSLIFLFGMYIVLHGHLTPGGGFAGGVIIALSFIHLVLAFGKEIALQRLRESFFSAIESFGGLMFLGIALLGLSGGYFFLNVLPKGVPFTLFSSGIIVLCNIAIFLKVSAGLFSIFIALAIIRMPMDDAKEQSR